METVTGKHSKKLHYALWTAQVVLALAFLFAGAAKFFMPAEQMTAGSPVPLWFIYFIGVCEILGAIGMILPGLTKIRPQLTALAAAGLVIIMIGAVVLSVPMGVATALVPLVLGIIAAFVAYGRWKLAPL